VLARLAPAFGAGLAVIAAETTLLYRRATRPEATQRADADRSIGRRRPFAFWPALGLAAVLTVVVLGARWGADVLGSGGAVLASALAGFADVHAAVLAVATLAAGGTVTTRTALAAGGVALATKTVSKCVLAFTAGGGAFGMRFTGLVALPTAVVTIAILVALR